MVDPQSYLFFIAAVLLICVTPGPDMMYIVANGVSQGVRAAVCAALGMAMGMTVHTTAVLLGLATLISSSPVAYEVLRYAGAVYLAYLGARTFVEIRTAVRAAREKQAEDPAAVGATEPLPMRMVFKRATVTNLLNPKIVVFYLAFLPQFVRPELGDATLQLLVLGVTFILLGLLVDAAVALVSGRVGDWLRGNNRVGLWLDGFAGVVFLGLAARIAVG
jgi:threonine/homoserine/homoserine lactone efflux protein